MYRSASTIHLILLSMVSVLPAQWPSKLDAIKKSICLVEYYQPQSETRNISTDVRIKRKITGILVNRSGLVITTDLIFPVNMDIVAGDNSFYRSQKPPEDITVSFTRDKKLKAQFIGKDEELRIAFIQITDKESLPEPVEFNNTRHFKTGDPLFILQHLTGRYDNELFISSAFINGILDSPQQRLLSDITIQPLSPGGLALDKKARAIGIVFRTSPPLSGNDLDGGEGLLENDITEILPAYFFAPLIQNPPQLVTLKEGGGKSWLGVQMQILKRDLADYWGLNGLQGIIVSSVVPRSPAEKAKLQVGDIITSIGSFQIKSDDEKIVDVFRNFIRTLPEGEVTVNLVRDHQPLIVSVYLESTPKSQFLADEFFDENLGLSVKELTQDLILNYDLDFDTEGVWVSRVEEAGPAGLAGLEVNDLIQHIDDTKIRGLSDFKSIIQKLEKDRPRYIQFFVRRDISTLFIFIKTSFTPAGVEE